jgi:hypothetical protein
MLERSQRIITTSKSPSNHSGGAGTKTRYRPINDFQYSGITVIGRQEMFGVVGGYTRMVGEGVLAGCGP